MAVRKTMHNRKNEAREERERQKLEAGIMSDRFPGVASIVIKLKYVKAGNTSLVRTLNFYPESPAFFRMTCLGEGCENGGLDLTRVITGMIKKRTKSAKGDLRCKNRDPAAVHADMAYTISLKFA